MPVVRRFFKIQKVNTHASYMYHILTWLIEFHDAQSWAHYVKLLSDLS